MAMTGFLIAAILRVHRKRATDENRDQSWNQAPHAAVLLGAATGSVTGGEAFAQPNAKPFVFIRIDVQWSEPLRFNAQSGTV